MGLFRELRELVLLRQIARELRRANDLTEARLALDHPSWYKSGGMHRKPHTAKLAHMDQLNVEAINKTWLEAHPPRMDDEDHES